MKVSELIAALQKLSPDGNVTVESLKFKANIYSVTHVQFESTYMHPTKGMLKHTGSHATISVEPQPGYEIK